MFGKRTHLIRGALAERKAAEYLIQQGARIIGQNYSCPGGEIDLIIEHEEFIVFVEVRFRSSPDYGTALESITSSKQRKIIHAAKMFLNQHSKLQSQALRFDALAITPATVGYHYHWVQNAFST